jgi:hypothetical protein
MLVIGGWGAPASDGDDNCRRDRTNMAPSFHQHGFNHRQAPVYVAITTIGFLQASGLFAPFDADH